MPIPADYPERVYAGVLGKIVGVYLGRPVESWDHARILRELGEIRYYVHEARGLPLVVSDDDISGTFTFLRALEDHGTGRDLTAAQIGETWLNYLIEGRTVLWWGGMGNSTEHTAYLRLKAGIPAPASGSRRTNGRVVSEQIGAQIFIDGWGMVAPGDPELAAHLARRAASVSHDGEAVAAAVVIAAMEAAAFVEPDLQRLLDTAVSLIPRDALIQRLIADLRAWRAAEPDWRRARERIVADYGYDRYGGNCHVVPNHALVLLALLYGGDDLQSALSIVNTCGWDTDCNSGNVGCLLGIKNGLRGIDGGPDWRGPVADRLYLPTADGGRCLSDALAEACRVVNAGRALAGLAPETPKAGARFHFEAPGAVQGFANEDSVECRGTLEVGNAPGHSRLGRRALALHVRHLARGRVARAATPTFIPPDALTMPGYGLMASPALSPGQEVRAALAADPANPAAIACRLFVRVYGEGDRLRLVPGDSAVLAPGAACELRWRVPPLGGQPVAEVGVELAARPGEAVPAGSVYLDWLTWDGSPEVTLARPADGGSAWRRAWVNGADHWGGGLSEREVYRLIQDRGTGLLIHGAREWSDYRVAAEVTPHMAASAGIAACVQGMRRYYALLLAEGNGGPGQGADRQAGPGEADAPRDHEAATGGRVLRLVKVLHGETRALAERPLAWAFGDTRSLGLEVGADGRLRAFVDGDLAFDLRDGDRPLARGGIALVCEEGRMGVGPVVVRPLGSPGGEG